MLMTMASTNKALSHSKDTCDFLNGDFPAKEINMPHSGLCEFKQDIKSSSTQDNSHMKITTLLVLTLLSMLVCFKFKLDRSDTLMMMLKITTIQ